MKLMNIVKAVGDILGKQETLKDWLDKDWLKRQTTVAEAEAAHMVLDDQLGHNPVPFGFQNACWQRLLAQMRKGDELWEFSSPAKTWQCLVGREGIVLVRNGNPVDAIVTMMN